EVLRVHPGGERSRTDQVREHHGDLAALGGVLRGLKERCGTFRWRGIRVSATTQRRDGVEDYAARTNGANTDFLQILLCQLRQRALVYLVLAKSSFHTVRGRGLEATRRYPMVARRSRS